MQLRPANQHQPLFCPYLLIAASPIRALRYQHAPRSIPDRPVSWRRHRDPTIAGSSAIDHHAHGDQSVLRRMPSPAPLLLGGRRLRRSHGRVRYLPVGNDARGLLNAFASRRPTRSIARMGSRCCLPISGRCSNHASRKARRQLLNRSPIWELVINSCESRPPSAAADTQST